MLTYLYQNKDDVLLNSSSGGAFSGIVKVFYDRYPDGVCYGSAFDTKYDVKHTEATCEKETEKFRTSKYCFSSYNEILPNVKNKLENGKAVLFSGTPCQVGALKSYLQKKNVNCNLLYTVDILCHGTPESKWWEEYKEWLEKKNKSKISFFSFRWKKAKWHGYSLCVRFCNGKEKINTHDLQVYMDLYFSHQIMRKCCYNCKYASLDRLGDITLGDFWGIDDVMPGILSSKQSEKGISLVIGNNINGDEILKSLKELSLKEECLMIECENKKYIQYQTALQKPIALPVNHKIFSDQYSKYGFEYILKYYANYNMKGKLRFAVKKIANSLGLISEIKRYILK